MANPERVRIFDTTLRDGEQSPGCSMNLAEKVRLACKLQDLGVDVIEAGFPIASDGDFVQIGMPLEGQSRGSREHAYQADWTPLLPLLVHPDLEA